MGIKNIVFDFGGVLVDWDPRYLYRGVFQDSEEMEYFLNNICNSAWNIKQDEGRTLEEGTKILQRTFPKYSEQIEMFYGRWREMVGGDISDNTKLLAPLKLNYHLFGLTNWSMETYPYAYNRFQFFQEFEGIVVSGEERVIKPGKEIYNILLDRYSIVAEESLFIDDNIDNINSAKELGFNTIHYTSGVDLKMELIAKGITFVL